MPLHPLALLAAIARHPLTIDEAFAVADVLRVPASVIFPAANHIGADAHAPTPTD